MNTAICIYICIYIYMYLVIGKQLASNFDTPGHLMLNTPVTSLSKGQVMASKCRGDYTYIHTCIHT